MKKHEKVFGEWLSERASGRAIRLVIEEMNEAAASPSVADAQLTTSAGEAAEVSFSSGSSGWPWRGDSDDPSPAITWSFPEKVDFTSLRIRETGENEWIRRYRIEVSKDGRSWQVAAPSRLIDSYHRQPCDLKNHIEALDSSLLPAGAGTLWAKSLYEDFMVKTVELIGPEHPYPDWFSGKFFLAAAVRPFGFGGVYNPGDSGNFDALIAAVFSPEMAVESQKLFPDLINRFGFMPGGMDPGRKDDRAFILDYSSHAWGPCCYWDIFAWSRDREFLGWFSDACAKWARWWLASRDKNADGWLEPGTNGCKPSSPEFRAEQAKKWPPQLTQLCPEFWDYTGLHDQNHSAFWQAVCEMPWDDNPIFVRGRHRGLRFDPKTCSVNIHFIETQLYISLLTGFVAHAYRILGRESESAFFQEQSLRLASLVKNNCWDEATGFYYDRDAGTGKLRTFVKHVGAFVPMMMGLPTMGQARRMVEHLTDPKEFWTDYPVPTLSRDSADYSPNGYWSGKTWPPTNFFVLRALLNYGFFDVADELLRRWVKHIRTCVERPVQYYTVPEWQGEGPHDLRHIHVPDVQWIVPETWNPETGALHGSGGLTWGCLWLPAVIMRHFWPVGEHSAIVRAGGYFRLKWDDRWNIAIDGNRAHVNGRSFSLSGAATYLLNDLNGKIRPLEAGRADPVLLSDTDCG